MLPGTKRSSEVMMRTLFGSSSADAACAERRYSVVIRAQASTFPGASAKFILIGRLSMFPAAFHLKQKLQSKLHLPRRAGIAGRESRVADPPEVLAANHSSGLAEAGMIEEIEHFRAHWPAHPLIEPGVLE